ncbi:MAG: hypothetical protein HQK77_04760 [Desulfobacterales bacterium]|nr:hypothetical protein [Desulfobacterales bacterium]
MREAAEDLTDNKNNVTVFTHAQKKKTIVAEFTIQKARQIDVVDRIGRAFHFINDYNDSAISFPNPPKRSNSKKKADKSNVTRFTILQGQYLAFIYHYTKLNGYPPEEKDFSDYFNVTSPSVYRILNKLQEKGLIQRIKGDTRSIRLLISIEDLPLLMHNKSFNLVTTARS